MTNTFQEAGAAKLPSTRDLATLAKSASIMEEVLREAAAVLDSIMSGGMFDAAPSDEYDARLHNNACVLLGMLRSRVQQCEDLPGTDLSIILSGMAKPAAQEVRA